jgi:hypothetical protein
MQNADVVDLDDPEHQSEQTGGTSERADSIQTPAAGVYAIAGSKSEDAQATQGSHRGGHQKTDTPTLCLHHQTGTERAESRSEAGQAEKKPDDSSLFCLTECARNQGKRHWSNGGAGNSVEATRCKEHSTRLRDRREQGGTDHPKGTEYEYATPAIDVTRNTAGEYEGA